MQSLLKEVPGNIGFTHTGESRVLKGITKDMITVPSVEIHLRNDFIDEPVLCGLVPDLPDGIDFLIGNDICLKSHPLPDDVIEQAILTRSAAKQITLPTDEIPISKEDTLLQSDTEIDLSTITDRETLIDLQKCDKTLLVLISQAAVQPLLIGKSYYFIQDDLLMHHTVNRKRNWSADQIVVPAQLRAKVLQLAHDIPAAGHLGIRKTQDRLEPHFSGLVSQKTSHIIASLVKGAKGKEKDLILVLLH